jgi:hypothetical protein
MAIVAPVAAVASTELEGEENPRVGARVAGAADHEGPPLLALRD